MRRQNFPTAPPARSNFASRKFEPRRLPDPVRNSLKNAKLACTEMMRFAPFSSKSSS